MFYRKSSTSLLLITTLGACQLSAQDQELAPSKTRPSVIDGSDSASPKNEKSDYFSDLGRKLFKDMAYADLRAQVLSGDWLPIQGFGCAENTAGQADICDELPELEACSSDGRCVMWFGNGATQTTLRVDTFGDYTKWKAGGGEALLNVRSWNFSPASPQDKQAAACPSGKFSEFLQAFASDARLQEAFTLPLVKVMQYSEIGGESISYPTFMKAAEYSGFRMTHAADGFHIVHRDGQADPVPTPIKIGAQDDGAYLVSYQYGMSEGNSYRFIQDNGCWYLAEDPDPPIA